MVSFTSDYIAGAHPRILERLAETNMESLPGYGTDRYCAMAAEKIKKACGSESAEVFFLTGGTQANQIIIDTMLKPYEGVIAAQTGHVSGHEAGAIEYTGHKVLQIEAHEGKIEAKSIDELCDDFYANDNHEHMVFPGMVYISFPTEYGTLYSLDELKAISDACRRNRLALFIDGARLGYGLMSYGCDVTMKDIAELADVFYVGGTKVGALVGEAVVFTRRSPEHFMTQVKQHGAMIAKGRLIGLQFDTLFTDDLYFEISRHAIEMAEKLKKLLAGAGLKFFLDSPTNQQFVVMDNETLKTLSEHVAYGFWEKYDETHTVVRFATSWSTTDDDLEELARWI